MNDNRAWTGEENGAFAVLSEAHVILDSIVGRDARPIAARLADVAADRARIAALEAENAALKAERDRDKAEYGASMNEAAKQIRRYAIDRDAARQSRARLVWLVRAKNSEFGHLMKLWGEARAWAAGWRRKAMKSHAMYVHMHAIYHRSNGSAKIFGVPYETVVDNALKLFGRAISGTAQQERSWRRMETVSRRARRAAEAADAQERR